VKKNFLAEETTIDEVQAAYRSGAITATQLVQAYLDRIHAYDQTGPKFNVVIGLNPTAKCALARGSSGFR
jgi:Asp-tRNA(Asn)/Glu-tRNA(Gln) amidotransferase A subunit family amidase